MSNVSHDTKEVMHRICGQRVKSARHLTAEGDGGEVEAKEIDERPNKSRTGE